MQLLDRDSVALALRFAREAANPYLRVGYNSLGAYATINHLHFQVGWVGWAGWGVRGMGDEVGLQQLGGIPHHQPSSFPGGVGSVEVGGRGRGAGGCNSLGAHATIGHLHFEVG